LQWKEKKTPGEFSGRHDEKDRGGKSVVCRKVTPRTGGEKLWLVIATSWYVGQSKAQLRFGQKSEKNITPRVERGYGPKKRRKGTARREAKNCCEKRIPLEGAHRKYQDWEETLAPARSEVGVTKQGGEISATLLYTIVGGSDAITSTWDLQPVAEGAFRGTKCKGDRLEKLN